MKRLLLTALLGLTATASAQQPSATAVMGPAERRIWVNSLGDVYEWQPGLGIVVLRSTTRVTRQRTISDGKSIIHLERSSRIEASGGPTRPVPANTRRADDRATDEGRSLMEEVEKPEVIPD